MLGAEHLASMQLLWAVLIDDKAYTGETGTIALNTKKCTLYWRGLPLLTARVTPGNRSPSHANTASVVYEQIQCYLTIYSRSKAAEEDERRSAEDVVAPPLVIESR